MIQKASAHDLLYDVFSSMIPLYFLMNYYGNELTDYYYLYNSIYRKIVEIVTFRYFYK